MLTKPMQYQPKPISRKNKVIHNQTWYNDKTPNFQLYVKKKLQSKKNPCFTNKVDQSYYKIIEMIFKKKKTENELMETRPITGPIYYLD